MDDISYLYLSLLYTGVIYKARAKDFKISFCPIIIIEELQLQIFPNNFLSLFIINPYCFFPICFFQTSEFFS